MLNRAELERQPRVFQSLAGLSPAAFAQLLPAFEQAYAAAQDSADAQRKQARERQRQYYSSKKKRHTVKNIVITDKSTRKIKALGPTCEGKKHDKAAVDETDFLFPPGSRLWQATGFQRSAPPGTTTYQPKKKPRGSELTPAEKETNQTISRERIGGEHSIGGTKVFRIVHEVFRNHRPAFDDLVMATACGLHNLRLDFRPQVA